MRVSRLEGALRHDIDVGAEQASELVLQVQQVEQRTARLELHQEVDVTRVRLIATSNGPKHRHTPPPVTPNGSGDLVSLGLDELAARTHVLIVPPARTSRPQAPHPYAGSSFIENALSASAALAAGAIGELASHRRARSGT